YIGNEKENLIHIMERLIKYMELRVAGNNIDALIISFNHRLLFHAMQAETLYKDMSSSLNNRIGEWSSKAEKVKASLDALNPRNIMDRGYAAILDGQGKLTGSADRFGVGDNLTAVMKDGEIICKVADVRRNRHGKPKEENQL
ncbi:MAG TPA: exodeoxyribonuclease VII large subunit, partial [Anaerovoracaceae bacterium]|nr:exodeoxyribonuclease VII large subunit [Anaerovoracaceae bacterium]